MTGRSAFQLINAVLALVAFASMATPVVATTHAQRVLNQVTFDQHIGQYIPASLVFTNAAGRRVRLGEIIDKPTVLIMAWYDCPNLCGMILHSAARSLGRVPFKPGEDFEVITVSIDPDEGPEAARRTRRELMTYAGADDGRGWYVLTGKQPAIRKLADAVGFRYVYDARTGQYAHPAGMILLDADGRINRYLFGVRFQATNLKLGLLEAGEGKLGTPVDRFVLSCYRFNPKTGTYTLEVMRVVRWLGLGTTVLLGGGIGLALRRERRRRKEHDNGHA